MDDNTETEVLESPSEGSEDPSLDEHQELKCPLCLDLFVDPCYVCPNHHTLCRACYQGVLDSSPMPQLARCPQCRDRLSRAVENGHMRDLIEAVRQLRRREQQPASSSDVASSVERLRHSKCQSAEGVDCQRRSFGHCGHCDRDLCDLHFSEHRLQFQAACQRQLHSASVALQVAQQHEDALTAWESLMDAFQRAIEERRTTLRSAASSAISSALVAKLKEAASQLQAALDAGDLRAASAARERLKATDESVRAAAVSNESSSGQLRPPPAQLNRQLVQAGLGGLLDQAEQFYRDFRGENFCSATAIRQKSEATIFSGRRRKLEGVRASDLAVVTWRSNAAAGDEEIELRSPPVWRGPEDGLRWPTKGEEAELSESPADYESLEATSGCSSKPPRWHRLPNTVLCCKSPHSRQLLIIEPNSGCHLATMQISAAAPHLIERLIYWSQKRHLLLSNGNSVLDCDLTGACLRRLSGFRNATDVVVDEGSSGDGRLLVLEARFGCVFVYVLDNFAPLQTLGPFGRSVHSMCWLKGVEIQCPPTLVLTDRAGQIRLFCGRNQLTSLTPELPPESTASTTPWLKSSTAITVSPSGDHLYIATPSSGIFSLPARQLFLHSEATNQPAVAEPAQPLISPQDLDNRPPSAMTTLSVINQEQGPSFELLVCSGEALSIDVFQLTIRSRRVCDDAEYS